YFDCFAGISGAMALGALVHAGADLDAIGSALEEFPVGPFALTQELVEVQGIAAAKIHLRAGPQGVIRTYGSIRSLLAQAELPGESRRTAERMYARLAQAAGRVHAKEPELVTFHEFGELDCLVEMVGVSLALRQLEVSRVYASPVPTGMGMIRTEHGLVPVPGPVV